MFVGACAGRGELDGVEIEQGRLYITRIKPAVPDAVRPSTDRLYGLLPRARITEVLTEVDAWTGLADHFLHLRTGNPAADPAVKNAELRFYVLATGSTANRARILDLCNTVVQGARHRALAWRQDGTDQQHLGVPPTALEKQGRKCCDDRNEAGWQGRPSQGYVECEQIFSTVC